MTETQLYLSIGLPTLAVMIGILVNVGHFAQMGSRMSSLEGRLSSLEGRLDRRIDNLDARIDKLETKFETRFDLLTGKVIDVDNRLSRLESLMKH